MSEGCTTLGQIQSSKSSQKSQELERQTHLVIPRTKLLLHAPPFRALQVGHERRESPLSLDTKTGLEVVLSENLVVSFVSRSRFTVRCSLVSSGRGVAGRGTREEGRGIRWSVGVGLCDYEIEEGCPGRAASGLWKLKMDDEDER